VTGFGKLMQKRAASGIPTITAKNVRGEKKIQWKPNSTGIRASHLIALQDILLTSGVGHQQEKKTKKWEKKGEEKEHF